MTLSCKRGLGEYDNISDTDRPTVPKPNNATRCAYGSALGTNSKLGCVLTSSSSCIKAKSPSPWLAMGCMRPLLLIKLGRQILSPEHTHTHTHGHGNSAVLAN